MFKVLFTDKAKGDLKKLSPALQKRIINKLKIYSENPFEYSRKLKDSSIGQYRFRIGDFRAAFDIDGENIVILRIKDRKDIYR